VATPSRGHAHPDGRIPDERRRQPRLYQPLPITVLAATADRDLLACGTWLDNCSAGGMYVRLPWPLAPGSPFIAACLPWRGPIGSPDAWPSEGRSCGWSRVCTAGTGPRS
jgi:hypothetical protein